MAEASGPGRDELVAAYKRLLQGYLDRRPSGMRLKIANAIGKHKSFVSQITNPAYPVPIPARHLESIFSICHFSPEERDSFLAAYHAAHPLRSDGLRADAKAAKTSRSLTIDLPDLGDTALEKEIEDTIRQFAQRVIDIAKRG